MLRKASFSDYDNCRVLLPRFLRHMGDVEPHWVDFLILTQDTINQASLAAKDDVWLRRAQAMRRSPPFLKLT